MRCPKCEFDHPLQTTECLKCGIVFSRYQAAIEAAATQASVAAPLAVEPLPIVPATDFLEDRADPAQEFKYRIFALPVALLVARVLTGTGLRMVFGMLAMVLHESGHAITAWFAGRWAVPMPWVTMHGDSRSWPVVLLLASAIIFGGYVAWRTERWPWLCAAVLLLLFQLTMLSVPSEAWIVFGGDGGALVLGTILMATFYAPRESALARSWGLRWGLLAIGALAFMQVYRLWSGPYADFPFGEIEGVNLSDPSLLTEMFGWSTAQLVDRYLRLADVCFAALLAVYVWGLISAYREKRSAGPLEKLPS